MESVRFDRERGQILVQVALMVVVLFAFVALALDVGHVYAGRRRMQNAADAGALAGARALCDGGDAETAEEAAREYAEDRNGADLADPHADGYTVTVVATQTLDTFFAGVIGINAATVRAEAAAICGPVGDLCKLWPIAFDYTLFYSDTITCDDRLLIWEKDDVDCSVYSCTCDYGKDDQQMAVANLEARTWVDFSAILYEDKLGEDPCEQGGCSASELKDRIHGETFYGNPNRGEECISYLEIPSCTPGDSGVKESVVKAVEDHEDEEPYAFIPLYDPDQSPCSVLPEQLATDPSAGCGDPKKTKWISDTVCIQVMRVCQLCLKGEDSSKCKGPKPTVIEARVTCDKYVDDREGCTSPCANITGDSPGAGDVLNVGLVE